MYAKKAIGTRTTKKKAKVAISKNSNRYIHLRISFPELR